MAAARQPSAARDAPARPRRRRASGWTAGRRPAGRVGPATANALKERTRAPMGRARFSGGVSQPISWPSPTLFALSALPWLTATAPQLEHGKE